MNSATPGVKKNALCRYFASSGKCFYGDDCQFLHENPRGKKFPNQPGPGMDGQIKTGRAADANNGDQFFTATFNSNGGVGLPEFHPFAEERQKNNRGSPLTGLSESAKPFVPASQASMQNQMVNRFAAMNVAPQMKGKSPNPGASEFVPKSSRTTTLSHSASTPAFSTYPQQLAAPLGPHPPVSTNAATHIPQIGLPLSAGTSPLHSPGTGMSPQNSPLAQRRNKSPIPPLNTTDAAGPPMTPTSASNFHMQENVGGTTYFYTQEEAQSVQNQPRMMMPNFTMFPSVPPHIAHMKVKSNMPSFFINDEIKMELLNRHAFQLMQVSPESCPDMPQEVDTYHYLTPLEPTPTNPLHKSSTFGYPTTVYKATNTKDGLIYCLRRIHGFRLVNTKCMDLINLWKKIQHSNIVSLREVFTTKAFNDHSMVFVYDCHPAAETLMSRHFSTSNLPNGYSNPYNLDGAARPFSAGKGANGPRHAGLLPESLLWSYIVQLSSALRTIHAHGLACRVMDPTKILLTGKNRLRLNCVGIFDVLSFDANQANPLHMMPHYQQEDLVSLGKVVLALACNSVIGIQREHIQTSMELVARNYSADLKNLILYLLTNQTRLRNVNDIMPMIGARFYTQLDASQLRNDLLENELAKEMENSRYFRLTTKLAIVNERPEFNMDPTWSETGDRYMLKLFRDHLFHQVDENGAPWIDMSHITQCLNKLDAGADEKIMLMSRDEQNVIVVSYRELKSCFGSAFEDLVNARNASQQAQVEAAAAAVAAAAAGGGTGGGSGGGSL